MVVVVVVHEKCTHTYTHVSIWRRNDSGIVYNKEVCCRARTYCSAAAYNNAIMFAICITYYYIIQLCVFNAQVKRIIVEKIEFASTELRINPLPGWQRN